MYVCIYRCSSRISSSRNSSGEESALTDALVPTPLPSKFFLSFFFFFLISILRQGMGFRLVSFVVPFYFRPADFFFFLHTAKCALFRSTLLKASRFIVSTKGYTYIYVSRPATSLVVLAGRLFVFRSTATPKINFDSAFVCLVDWQRCTQAVTRVYEREWERRREREKEKREKELWKCDSASEVAEERE